MGSSTEGRAGPAPAAPLPHRFPRVVRGVDGSLEPGSRRPRRSPAPQPSTTGGWSRRWRRSPTAGASTTRAAARSADLAAYRRKIAAADPDTPAPGERLAFWINAYNACGHLLLAERMPVRSVLDIDGALTRIRFRVGRRGSPPTRSNTARRGGWASA